MAAQPWHDMWLQLAGEEELPRRGALKRFQRHGMALAVLRGKDGEIYVTEDAVPPLRQSLLSPGASVDARLLRGSCQVFGTKFDLQSGEVMGPWCPQVEQSPLLLALLLRLVLLLRFLVGDTRRLRCLKSRLHQGKLEVQLEPMPKFSSCQGVSLAVARWLLLPRETLRWTGDVELQVLRLKEDPETEELKISVVPKGGGAELGRAFLRLPKSKTQPQMAQLVRQSFAQPELKDVEARCAVWVAQYVVPSARGRGLDQRMLSKILDLLHFRGFDFLLLMVDGRSQHLKTQLEAHYESQGFVKIAEPNVMGLQRAMLRPVRSVPRPGAPAPSVAAVRSGATLREAAKDGLDVGKNAFLLAHGYVCLPLLIEFVKLLPFLRNGQMPSVQTGPMKVLMRTMMILGYVKVTTQGDIGFTVVESEEVKAWEELLKDSEELLELYQVPLPFDLDSSSLPGYLSLRLRLRRRLEIRGTTWPPPVLALFDCALLAPLAVALFCGRNARPAERPACCSADLDPLLRQMALGHCEGGLELLAMPLQRCQTLLVATSYAPMLAKFQHVLYKEPSWGFNATSSGEELHVDRTLNVLGSGLQHKAFFRDLLELLKPLFTCELKQQPRYVADTGCGDGSLLMQIYNFVCKSTLRGEHLKDFPLTMIGIDLNDAALQAAGDKLSKAQVPHQLIHGDIGQPGAIIQEMRHRGIDPRQVLHVRSFLDHDRPYVAPVRRIARGSARALFVRRCFGESAYLDGMGQELALEDVYQSLVEHLRRWSVALHDTTHGLCLLEAMVLDVENTQKYFNDNVAFHFDVEAALSRQYLVPPKAFCLALAEAGLLSYSGTGKLKTYPETGEYCRIMNQHVKRSPFRLRLAESEDLEALEALQERAQVGKALEASRQILAQRLRLAPVGTFVAEADAPGLLGAIYTTQLVDMERNLSAEPSLPAEGEVMQIIALHADPEAPGVGALLRDFVLQLQRVEHPGVGCIGLSRCSAWSPAAGSMEDYVRKHQAGELSDKVLAFHSGGGAQICGVVSAARPQDVENQGAAVLIHYESPGMSETEPSKQGTESMATLESDLRAELEQMDQDPGHGDADADADVLQLDSLELAQLQRRLERLGCRKRFAVRLSLADLAREGGPTVKRLAEVIRQGLGEASG